VGLRGAEELTGRETQSGLSLRGLKIWVCVLGCRSNLYDGEALSAELTARGAQILDGPEGCRAAVIVSCSVTAAADKKCRQAVRRARRELARVTDKKNAGVVAVCGCWAQGVDAEEARGLGVNLLVGNRRKSALPDALESALETPEFADMRGNPDDRWDPLRLNRPILHTRAFLKVQEGCDRFCSYCVVPFLRGRPVSRPPEETLEEARRVTVSGCGEIVLTGVHLGMYGRDLEPGSSLAELVRRVSCVPGLKRLRLGSLEPFALSGDLLEALADSPVFCPHLHLPLQSGDDEILALMRRGHGADDFARLCERAREKLGEDLHIGSDVLVGFPGESEGAFRNTLALMKRAGLGRVHVFPYSPRPNTAAAALPRRVPPEALSERVSVALALGEELLTRYASRFVGHSLSVLAEGGEEARTARAALGYTRHFVSVSLERGAVPERSGREIEVLITGCAGGELKGEIRGDRGETEAER
jgi:threonylcarbamoyladenosine tRNA methylthiotransferase MtaB